MRELSPLETVGLIAMSASLLDWILLETAFAAGHPDSTNLPGQTGMRLLTAAKEAVRDDGNITQDDRSKLQTPLREIERLFNLRGDAVHGIYLYAPGFEPEIIEMNLKKGSDRFENVTTSPQELLSLNAEIMRVTFDLEEALDHAYPTRGYRPGSMVTPKRGTIVAPE